MSEIQNTTIHAQGYRCARIHEGSRFTEEQISLVLKAAEGGEKTTDLCQKHGISE